MGKCLFQLFFLVIWNYCVSLLFQFIHSLNCSYLYNAQECTTFNYIFEFQNVNWLIGVWKNTGNSEWNWWSNKCGGWIWNQNTENRRIKEKTKRNCQWRGLYQLLVHEVEKCSWSRNGLKTGKCQMCQRPFQWDKNTQGLLSLERNIFLYCSKYVDIHFIFIALQERELTLRNTF